MTQDNNVASSSDSGNNFAESFRLSEERMKEIEDETKQSPLTSMLKPLTELEQQYREGPFLAGVAALQKLYGGIRMVRGDGNCYYRAFLFALAETLCQDTKHPEGQRILTFLKEVSWKHVKEVGYNEMTIEMFYEEAVSLIERVISGSVDAEALLKELNEENSTSDYCTWYLRVVTATHLKMDPQRFEPFIEQPGMYVAQFCRREVEPMGKECEQLQVLALAEAFGVKVRIEYLDGHEIVAGDVIHHVFGPENSALQIYLLYRPGHYDILYPKKSSV
ncbi:ubiquitin thioesterase protein OTUB1 [Fistulifera solaris]|uniref:ubiquitinyl hydrolase 1 n=1 Tax=Fistulifera solaris TaxID=1519565 RepID=A0A1Z5J6M5_FISSO|nr:ubiquitin thioesterase protein OTUB1 [Fistulifera solaris]|eukprot:GAX09655.1 ubiquitin thioesterase protein OTUB1 [Fistulifera solaris]